ncbi:MAG: SDR family NAD(P)-dependent oxidoreductase, partial [Burkholderiaceae bacterium]
MERFADRVAVITGAASGFGLAFAQRAALLGMRLVLADVEAAPLERAAAQLVATGANVRAFQTDVSNAEQMAQLADRAFSEFGAVHLLFNNAGVAPVGLIWEQSAADWQWVLGVNVMGVANGLRSFVPRMLEQNDDSHIVNTASVAGFISPTTMGLYSASKHAVVTISETLHHDLRAVGSSIGVTVLCPAFVPTGIAQSERNRPAALAGDQVQTSATLRARAA